MSLFILCLPEGYYIIYVTIGIERKRADDFVQCIKCSRLFDQIARLKRSVRQTLLIVETNPYATVYDARHCAILEAVLSVLVFWQAFVIFSKAGRIPL
ncbi:MAG: hypothetical protein JST63_17815 [Bacteroidetes bacterium]|nr:hypothetical protein [Bacteroidota bacterium]